MTISENILAILCLFCVSMIDSQCSMQHLVLVLLSNNADEMPTISLGHLIELDKHMRNLFMEFAMNSKILSTFQHSSSSCLGVRNCTIINYYYMYRLFSFLLIFVVVAFVFALSFGVCFELGKLDDISL